MVFSFDIMIRTTLLLPVIVLFLSCNNEKESQDPVFTQPAYKKLTDSIAQMPDNAELYYHRGSLFFHNNQLVHAKADLLKAWQLAPTETHALSLVTVLRQQHVDSALQFIRSALKTLPNSVALQAGLARGLQAKGNRVAAMQAINQVLERWPGQLDALLLKSELLQQEGKEKEALQVLELAYNYAPGDKEIGYELAWAYAEAGNARALKLADRLSQYDSTETAARAAYIKGHYHQKAGDGNKALAAYDESIRKNYNFLDAHLDKGILLYEQKKYSEAESAFQLGLRVSPATADFYYWTGKAQQAQGRKDEARANYQRALGLDNSLAEAKEALRSL